MIRIIGFTLFILGLSFIMIIMPNAQDIRIADSVCNAEIDIMGYKVEIGLVTQIALNSQKQCSQIHLLRLGVDYAWILLVVGSILFFVGVWAGLGAREKKEIMGLK